MNCPRTGSPLTKVKVGGVILNISERCGGVWFDNHEIHKFVSPISTAGKILVEHLRDFHNPLTNDKERLKCPIDTNVVMMSRYYSAKQQIEIDECPACGGIWLDTEELKNIRELFPSEGDHEKIQNDFVEKVLASSEAKMHNQEIEKLSSKVKLILNVLRSMV